MVRHFLDLCDLSADEVRGLIDSAASRKQARLGWFKGRIDADAPCRDRRLAMIFEKNSTRTRFSFDTAMRQLGGDTLITNAGDMQLGRGEPVADTARVLSRMVDAIMIRANSHDQVLELAAHATIPVINGLTDRSHPCQILADILTIEERRGPVTGKVLAWIGDGNNVCNSFIHAAARLGFSLRIAAPDAYRPDAALLDWAKAEGADVSLTFDKFSAADGADAVITDTWVSMGDADYEARMKALSPYTVDAAVMQAARPDALFLHCLPAHRGEEVTAEIIDGPQSVIWDEAENRIHAQKAVLAWVFGAL